MLSVCKVAAPCLGSKETVAGKPIPLTLPAILGRGPLLKCAETKVSRRHSTLDWDDDGVVIQAVHANPTFVVVAGKQSTLNNGQSATLHNGDLFGLLPNSAWYRISLPVNSSSTSSAATSKSSVETVEEADPTSAMPESAMDEPNAQTAPPKPLHNTKVSVKGANKRKLSNIEETSSTSASGGSINEDNAVETISNADVIDCSKADNNKENITTGTDDISSQAVSSKEADKNPAADKDEHSGDKMEVACKKMKHDNLDVPPAAVKTKPAVLAPQRIRALPAWLTQAASSPASASANETLPTATTARAPRGRKQTGARGGRRRNNASATSPKQKTNEEKQDTPVKHPSDKSPAGKSSPAKTRTPPKQPPRSVKALHYMSDSESDTEVSGAASTVKQHPAAGSSSDGTITPGISPTKVPSSDSTPTMSNTPESSPTKTDTSECGGAASTAAAVEPKPQKAQVASVVAASDSEDDTGGSGAIPSPATGDQPATGSNQPATGSNQPPPARRRKCCPYGAGCYRRNPQHKLDEAHPGDPDYHTAGSDSEAEDDRPECEFGVDCYRKNPQHRRQYRHTRLPQRRAVRNARRKREAGEDGDSDDSYDYDDPFLNDDSSDDYAPSDSDSGSEYAPSQPLDEDEKRDLKRMKREANKFVKGK